MNGYSSFNSFMGSPTPICPTWQHGPYNNCVSRRYHLPKAPIMPPPKKTHPVKTLAGIAAAVAGTILVIKKGPAAFNFIKTNLQKINLSNIKTHLGTLWENIKGLFSKGKV